MTMYHPLKGDVFSDMGYEVFEIDDGWVWRWFEPGESDEVGPWFETRAECLLDVAADWDRSGSDISGGKKEFRALLEEEAQK